MPGAARLDARLGDLDIRIHEVENARQVRTLNELREAIVQLRDTEVSLPSAREVLLRRRHGVLISDTEGTARSYRIFLLRGEAGRLQPVPVSEEVVLEPGDILEVRWWRSGAVNAQRQNYAVSRAVGIQLLMDAQTRIDHLEQLNLRGHYENVAAKTVFSIARHKFLITSLIIISLVAAGLLIPQLPRKYTEALVHPDLFRGMTARSRIALGKLGWRFNGRERGPSNQLRWHGARCCEAAWARPRSGVSASSSPVSEVSIGFMPRSCQRPTYPHRWSVPLLVCAGS